MAKKDGKNDGKQDGKNEPDRTGKWLQPRNPMRYARQMLRAYRRPMYNELARAQATAKADYDQYANQADAIYNAVLGALPGISSSFQTANQGNMDAYQQALTQLSGLVGSAPSTETAAVGGYLGNMGASGQSILASQGLRNAGYGASASRQAVIDQANVKLNALTELQQLLDDIRQQRVDVMREAKAMMPEWAQQGREYNLALGEYDLRKQALEGQLAGYDAANAYYASTVQPKPGKGPGAETTQGPGPMGNWLGGATKWRQLSPQQQATIREQLRQDPAIIRKWFPMLHPKGMGMNVAELIRYLNQQLAAGARTTGEQAWQG